MGKDTEDSQRWSEAAALADREFFLAPLAAEREGRHAHRHASHASECGRVCWDSASSCVVVIKDWIKDEYWGERVLEVEELAPNPLGLRWDRRQSQLCELGPAWQGMDARAELRQLDEVEKQRMCASLGRWWGAMREAEKLGEVAEAAPPQGRKISTL